MNLHKAKQLSEYHKFTKIELYEILVQALAVYDTKYWRRASNVNAIFDNGYHFNQCRKWINYQKGINGNDSCSQPVTMRILQAFGRFSKVQLPIKSKPDIKILNSEAPIL